MKHIKSKKLFETNIDIMKHSASLTMQDVWGKNVLNLLNLKYITIFPRYWKYKNMTILLIGYKTSLEANISIYKANKLIKILNWVDFSPEEILKQIEIVEKISEFNI